MPSEEQVLNEIHFRNMFKELKDAVQHEVSSLLDEKLSKWEQNGFTSNISKSATNCSNSSNSVTCSNCKHVCSELTMQPKDPSKDATDSWSPDYSRATYQVERTQAVTRALTRSHSKRGRLAVPTGRVFISRPSLLSELLEVSHINSLYNIFVAILCLLLVHKLLEDTITLGSINLEMSMIIWCFGKLDSVITIWLGMFIACSVGLYSALHTWSYNRHRNPRVCDVLFGAGFMVFLCMLLYVPAHYLVVYDLPLASSFIVLCEQVRFFMKSWAFVRSNLSRAVSPVTDDYKKTDGDKLVSSTTETESNTETAAKKEPQSKCPSFSQHLYFLFIPTLVYRDEYPRSRSINWYKVAVDIAQVIGCIFYAHFLFVRFCVPVFKQFGTQTFSATHLLVSVFSSCFPASLLLLCAFFAVLHAWMNAFAEMLKFSDRMFYKDWWNSTSYARFYRTWNCVVHDWLYEYIYMELHTAKPTSWFQRYLPTLLVFLISSLVHEYILAFAFRFFYPVLLFMFGVFGVVLMFIKTRAKQFNVFLWVSLILGTGILVCLYSLEWYARLNCPPVYSGFVDLMVPRSWFCQSLH